MDKRTRIELAAIGLSCLALIASLGTGLSLILLDKSASLIGDGLTNVATIGGIVSGLSLSGTAVLALSGRYTAKVAGKYGGAIRFVLFGGFAVLVTASLLCAVSVIWVHDLWPRFVLGYTVPLLLVVLIATAMLINSAFSWNEPRRLTMKPSPYRQ